MKEQISDLIFLLDRAIHTININKEIKYKNDGKKIVAKTKQKYSSKRSKKDKIIKGKLSKNITKSDLLPMILH